MAKRSSPAGTRRRLPASEARTRILDAAERKLADVGPESLRLAELASELGISHPAILHHFGSREELVRAVIERATARLNQRLASALSESAPDQLALFDLISEFYNSKGNARLLAWMALSGLAPRYAASATCDTTVPPLQRLVELAHQRRIRRNKGRDLDYGDTEFRSQLAALALLGEAIFGDMIRLSCGSPQGPDAARDFRQRLASLLREHP